MEVERGLQALIVDVGEKVAGVGKQRLVPGVAGPSKIVMRLVDFAERGELLLADVPAHVDDQHVERDVVLMEAAHQLIEFLVGVVPVA